MAKIVILKGLPASGKTSWAMEKIKTGNYFRVSKDVLRDEMLGGYTVRKERMVIKLRNLLIKEGIALGKNVIIDDTNLNPIHENAIRRLGEELGVKVEVNDEFLEVSPEVCIERDLKRQKSVGASVIWEMYDKWVAPQPEKLLDENWKKKRCVIFDVDGTLAHMTNRTPYEFNKVMSDKPDSLLSLVVDSLHETVGRDYLDIIILSGRSEDCRKETEEWLDQNMIPYEHLYMRASRDKRDDVTVKRELYEQYIEPNYGVLGVFDDRPKVARMWRKLGLKVAQMGNPYIEF